MLTLVLIVALGSSYICEYIAIQRYATITTRNVFVLLATIFSTIVIAAGISIAWPLGLILAIIGIYHYINLARLLTGRLPQKHMQGVALRTLFVLATLQMIIVLLSMYSYFTSMQLQLEQTIAAFVLASCLAAYSLFVATFSNLIGSRTGQTQSLTNNEYPTVTIAIAARNETPMLVDCLESIVASDYPKLEILVFDDNSQDTTAEIIKSYAQQGVRFITWEYQDGDWLSKNKAYQTLLEHASGEVVMYMGVDVRIEPSTVRKAVEQLLYRDVAMMSVVPRRIKSGVIAIFIQPVRYWRELALPKLVKNRPPVLSTVWLIYKKSLLDLGGFKSYKKSIIPEEHFARHFSQQHAYSFVRASKNMLFTTQKSFGSQWDTQIRTRYPQTKRRPEAVLLQSLALVSFVIWPFAVLPLSMLMTLSSEIVVLAGIASGFYIISHVFISLYTNPISAVFAPINFPIAIALDIAALHVSMCKYEFSKVIWKGRDIAPKKLKVIAKLPDIETTQGSENKH